MFGQTGNPHRFDGRSFRFAVRTNPVLDIFFSEELIEAAEDVDTFNGRNRDGKNVEDLERKENQMMH